MHTYALQDCQIIINKTNKIRKLYLELSSECNFTCEMCFRHHFSTPLGTMSDATFQRVLAQLEHLPWLKEIVIGGIGEPLLHKNFTHIVKELKDRGYNVTVTSNGSLIEPLIDFLISIQLDKIVLSYESGDIGHANESEILKTIKLLNQRKILFGKEYPLITLLMVMTQENLAYLPQIAQKLKGSGIKEVLLSNLLPASESHRKLVLYPYPEPAEVTTFKNDLLLNILLEKTRCQTPKFDIRTERSCDFVDKNAVVIRWDGAVAPCYRFLHSSTELVLNHTKEIKACVFGDVNQTDLLDIWNDRDYTWFRHQVKNSAFPSCIDCTLRDGCDLIESTENDCWGNENTCADCLWSRSIVKCP